MRVHLDTDFGGDTDDACALAYLLGRADVELVGVTTVADHDGLRAAYARHLLRLAGRADVPVAAGAAVSLTTGERADPVTGDPRHWPLDLAPAPSPPGAAPDLLDASVAAGARVIGIGPFTTLALYEVARPGRLATVPLTLMGGWVDPPAAGLPDYGPDLDFNVRWDTRAAEILVRAARPTLATLPATLAASLSARDLPRLRAAGPVGALLARQAEAHAAEYGMPALGRAHPGLPDDLLNNQYDPVACAIATGWAGATIEDATLVPTYEGEVLRFVRDPAGVPARVVTAVDGDAFAEHWLGTVERLGRR